MTTYDELPGIVAGPIPDGPSKTWAQSVITYLVNVRSGVVHKRVDGRSYEQCNVDQIVDARVVASLEDVGAVTKRSVRYCRRCFRG